MLLEGIVPLSILYKYLQQMVFIYWNLKKERKKNVYIKISVNHDQVLNSSSYIFNQYIQNKCVTKNELSMLMQV